MPPSLPPFLPPFLLNSCFLSPYLSPFLSYLFLSLSLPPSLSPLSLPLQVTVKQRSRALNIRQRVRTGVLFMVDLAGSERAANTQVPEQRRRVEGGAGELRGSAVRGCVGMTSWSLLGVCVCPAPLLPQEHVSSCVSSAHLLAPDHE